VALRPGWLKRGTWQPGRTGSASGTAMAIIQCAVISTCAVRGLDYLRHDPDPSSVLSRVQDSAPLTWWGMFFIAAAIVAAAGLAGRWGAVAAIGHIMAMVAYAGIAFGLFLVTGLGPGVRTPWGLAMTAIIHGALGIGIFATIRRREMIAALPPESLE